MQKKKDWNRFDYVEVREFRNHRRYPSLEDAVRAVGWFEISKLKRGTMISMAFCGTFFANHRDYRHYDSGWHVANYGDRYEFRDENGFLIPLWRVQEVARHLGLHNAPVTWWWGRNFKYKFRDGPVPGIRSWWRWGNPRRPYALLHREYCNDIALLSDEDAIEYGIKPRKRGVTPDDRDNEYGRFDCKERSWKKHRRHQWRC